LGKGRDFGRDKPKDAGVAAGLLEKIATKARLLVHFISEVEVAAGEITVPLSLRADRLHQFLHHRGIQILVVERVDRAVHTQFRRLALAEMEIRTAGFNQRMKKFIDLGHGNICENP
jgi:hypothetical protein